MPRGKCPLQKSIANHPPCFHTPHSGAFRVNRLYGADANGKDLTGCKGAAFSAGKVPDDLKAQLDCVWPSYAGACWPVAAAAAA